MGQALSTLHWGGTAVNQHCIDVGQPLSTLQRMGQPSVIITALCVYVCVCVWGGGGGGGGRNKSIIYDRQHSIN